MGRIQVEGKACLQGTVSVQGSKNAALPMMAAALLHAGRTRLHNCPRIADVFAMEDILHGLGVHTFWAGHTLVIDSTCLLQPEIPADAASRLRASVLLAGSLLGRCHCAVMGYPGGCAIGSRPVDLHLEAFVALGAIYTCQAERLVVEADQLYGTKIRFRKRSVGATENALLAAVCACGESVLENAAIEPEVLALTSLLHQMGADIVWTKEGSCRIRGQRPLHGTDFLIPFDRIEAGTWLFAGAMTRGRLMIHRAPVEQMAAVLSIYRKMGGQYLANSGTLIADSHQVCRAIEAETDVYPGFPTDLQPVLMAVCATLHGESRIRETVFENRFRIAEQLNRLGADIHIQKDTAYIAGPARWRAGTVEATDLRAGAALVLAGLVCEDCVTIKHSERIDRGYEEIDKKIHLLGGRIRKEKD